ncbi:DNA/RNA polymerases superfamily protein [Gossypium australe]|uniref:DNA/RNA polymerases superfamily protein n=1 Tax=Gossypium australe TaxID=47621 RepID=A0A5B6VCQ0_9ROSI|nr:DNA/RNA polymerases superfamily protein [Gossypium australe]
MLPRIDNLFDQLKGVTMFSKIDLRYSYYQLRVKDVDVLKTTFKTRYGHYKFLVDKCLNDIYEFDEPSIPTAPQQVYHFFFHDILIYSKNEFEHAQHLKIALQTFAKKQLYTKFSKYEFWFKEVGFLGHVISTKRIQVDLIKISYFLNMKPSRNVSKIHSFLGLARYYLRFKDVGFIWSEKCQQSFDQLKNVFTDAPMLTQPESGKEFIITECKVIAYSSRQLKTHEKNFSMHDLELAAVVFALKIWCHYLYDYHPGEANIVVNALSRKSLFALRSMNAQLQLERDGSILAELKVKPSFL